MSKVFTIVVEAHETISRRDVSEIVHECIDDLPEPEYVRLLSINEDTLTSPFIPRNLEVE
jgi:hypothetical protein